VSLIGEYIFMKNFVYFKGEIVEEEQARVPLATHALQYGTGVFDSVRGYWLEQKKAMLLLKPLEHFERLVNSAKILGLAVKETPAEMTEILKKLVKKNALESDIYVRPFIYQAATKVAPIISPDFEPSLAMYMISLGDYLATDKGLKGKVSSWRRIDDTMIPPRAKVCGAYVNSSLARQEAAMCGADEAIFLNQDGSVCEGSGENIFIVRAGQLITPPVSANILEGVTRSLVMEVAGRERIGVCERCIDRSELYIADEVFLTGTACQVAYFSEIDGRQIGDGRLGPITKKLQKIFFDAVHGRLPEYVKWLVQV